ncbi:alpha/beta hydrolase family protein [Halalkalibacter akibai]|uniref:Dipeptidyl aminopeptidases/acylaminoacyl-peptidases n=1 Tax=Halalkalibacter akibai (strain ATCC 43226 / DSM 21942 / CIP 109018 / JCM 9157 / 1139) TaxID=1236973 RepID=W4QQ70_HALA3|nr:prolyl oligopeptidase family serine peptidase [Halalkalibacter akibai]GAE34226.1 dipeptidyl aminopeptidases/acylaminoacyl-peptidases [Halalkalibacter akibai JCM 9157]
MDHLIDKVRIPSPHPLIHLYLITYLSNSYKVKGYLAIPQKKEQMPGLLYLRGGIKNVGMVRIQRVIQWAAEGFVVIAPFYRGNKGGEGQEDFCGDDREDAFSAFDLIQSLPQVQSDSIHILGFSRGGVMALLTGQARPQAASIVCWNGVTDMVLTYEERIDLRRMMKRVIGGTPSKYPERYKWRTPLHFIDDIQSRILIIHGAKDEHVSLKHAELLAKSCQFAKKEVDCWIFKDYRHHFPLGSQRHILTAAAKWMKKREEVISMQKLGVRDTTFN